MVRQAQRAGAQGDTSCRLFSGRRIFVSPNKRRDADASEGRLIDVDPAPTKLVVLSELDDRGREVAAARSLCRRMTFTTAGRSVRVPPMLLTRRALLAAGLSSLAGPAGTASAVAMAAAVSQTPPSATNARHIMPVPAGSRNGEGWANAASLWQLSAMIAAVGPGGTVFLRADAGSYSLRANRVNVSRGGQAGLPVTIIGVDKGLNPKKATIAGTRTNWILPDDPEVVTNVGNWSVGSDIFFLTPGADYLAFRFFDFQSTGQPFHLSAPMHKGITVSDCDAHNFQRFLEHDPGTSHVDTVLRNITGSGFSKTAIRIRGDSHNVLLEDITLNSGRQDGANFATGVECNETAHDITMRRVEASNCHDTHYSNADGFWNADGFASERGNYNIRREECTSSGNTDAGYDDKGTNVTNVNCTARGNKVNYKFWGPSTTNINCQALDPKSRGGTGAQMQYYVYGGHALDVVGADVLIRGGVISDNDPDTYVFVAQGHNSVFRIAGPTITKHADAVMETELEGWGNAFLAGSPFDVMSPTITSAASVTAVANINFAHLLSADKPVTWSIVGGADATSFKVLPDRRVGTLNMTAASGGANRQVVVRATDANGNNADQTMTLAFGASASVFFRDDFTRADQDLGARADWRFAPDGGGDGRFTDIAIRSKMLAIFNTGNGGAAYVSPDCGFADHYVQATVASTPAGHNGMLACRITNPSNLIGVEFTNKRISLYERTNGVFKELGLVDARPVVGDVIRLEIKGASAAVKKNGVVIIGQKVTAATKARSTWAGVLSRNLAVNPWIDNYESGPI